jgi:hypothetical protein
MTMKNVVFCDVTPCGSCKNLSEELSASFIRVTRIDELGTTLAVTISYYNIVTVTGTTLAVTASYS